MFCMDGFPRSGPSRSIYVSFMFNKLDDDDEAELVALVLTSLPNRAIPVGRQNLEIKVLHARRTWTRSAPLADVTWLWVRPLPPAAGHPSQEQIASAKATRTQAATTGIGQKTSTLPLSYSISYTEDELCLNAI